MTTLTPAEREAIGDMFYKPGAIRADLFGLVERILTDRLDAQRKAIAVAISAERDHFRHVTGALRSDLVCSAYDDAARVARQYEDPKAVRS